MNISLSENSGFSHCTCPSLNCYIKRHEGVQKHYISEYYQLPFACSLPLPFDDPVAMTDKHLCGLDRTTELVNIKKMWEVRKNSIINRSVKSQGPQICSTTFNKVKKVCNRTLELAEHLMLDPDPKFSGNYNWYFSDGCVNSLLYFGRNYLLYTHSTAVGSCIITPVEINRYECVPLKKDSLFLRTGHEQPILQMCVNDNFIAVRQKHSTSLFTVISDEELKFKKIHSHSETKDNIVSTSICDDLDGEYCTLTTSHKLKIWSPEIKDKCISFGKIKKCTKFDKWGSIKYVTNNNIAVANRSLIYLKDTRLELDKNIQKWKINVKELPCDVVSLLIKDKNQDSCVYIGTTHHLYELDLRMGLSKQWSHMLEYQPMFGVVLPSDVNNNILIGSQNINEVCLMDSNLHVLPYTLPAPKETLSYANSQGICLDPIAASRFHFNMIGFTAFSDPHVNNNIFVFRNTSLDDMFYQSMVYKDDDMEDFDRETNINTESLINWEANCVKSFDMLERTPRIVTSIADCSKIFNKLDKDELKSKRKNSTAKTGMSLEYLKKMKMTTFSKTLLDVWKIDEIMDSDQYIDLQQPSVAPNIEIIGNSTTIDTINPSTSASSILISRQFEEVIQNVDEHEESINYLNHFDDFVELEHNHVTSNVTLNKKNSSQKTSKKSRMTSGF